MTTDEELRNVVAAGGDPSCIAKTLGSDALPRAILVSIPHLEDTRLVEWLKFTGRRELSLGWPVVDAMLRRHGQAVVATWILSQCLVELKEAGAPSADLYRRLLNFCLLAYDPEISGPSLDALARLTVQLDLTLVTDPIRCVLTQDERGARFGTRLVQFIRHQLVCASEHDTKLRTYRLLASLKDHHGEA